jgi:hypothetical protein
VLPLAVESLPFRFPAPTVAVAVAAAAAGTLLLLIREASDHDGGNREKPLEAPWGQDNTAQEQLYGNYSTATSIVQR